MKLRLVLDQSEKGNYNPNLVRINKIRKKISHVRLEPKIFCSSLRHEKQQTVLIAMPTGKTAQKIMKL